MAEKQKMTEKIKKTNSFSPIINYPRKLLSPVLNFLSNSLKLLKKRKKQISREDPFKNSTRLIDNASPDADAEEQFGHARIVAIKEQLQDKIVQTKRAINRLKKGKYGICEDCSGVIDTDRLSIYAEATLCAKCQAKREK